MSPGLVFWVLGGVLPAVPSVHVTKGEGGSPAPIPAQVSIRDGASAPQTPQLDLGWGCEVGKDAVLESGTGG